MPAPEIIIQLVKRFEENRDAYRSGKYNEARLRQEFLDPFFEALGWDVYNKNGMAPEYAEVAVEDSLEIEGASKAPDYAFKIGRERKFFVEAKKPRVDIEYDIHPAYQLRRYAWNAHMPLSILTDFEEFAVYNCKNKPNPTDSAATGRDKFYRYTDYIEKWDEIAAVFSKDAVWKGGFDRFAESSKGKKGTTEVDDAFLADIEDWRLRLARNIALRNPQVEDEKQLNYAVQMTIDRIIFLRICEDRGIEPEEQLKTIAHNPGVYPQLVQLFRRADVKYNSGLFHLNPEKGEETAADTFTPGLSIDDKVLKEIIDSIYYPCQYIFKEIPVEILGQVYEQFLGKVIRLTAGHTAKVDEKPEVRKAGGVYYTPRYIVDYIVTNTVGELLKDKTPESAAELKIVDPACGSGSFLLGAFQHLLDWHLDWYLKNDPEKWARGKNPALVQVVALTGSSARGYKLTTQKKKEILVNNIHGVDIDAQAVEVTKLSLLLKVLEEESGQLSLGLERILPDLGKNIQCGNSLIGEDYFEGRLTVEKEERERVNPFEWRRAFPQVFAQGGFDAVIGNPPYRMMQPHNTEMETLGYFRKNFVAADYKIDLFHMFLQLAISITRHGGYQSYIIPSTILNNVYAEKLRSWIFSHCEIKTIAVANERVFEGVDVYTLVLILRIEKDPQKRNETEILTTTNLNAYFLDNLQYSRVTQENFSALPGSVWNVLVTKETAPLIIKLSNNYSKLGEVASLNRGLITGDRERYFSNKKVNDKYVPIIAGSDVGRYFVNNPKEFILLQKPSGAGGSWDPEMHLAEHKLLVRQIGTRPMATIITEPYAITGNLFSIRAHDRLKELYILGIFNSKLIAFFWKIMFTDFKNAFPQVTLFSLSQIPIRYIDLSNPNDEIVYERITTLVQRMIDLHKREPKTTMEQEQLKREIESTDREIDKLVYELYGLTEEEIRVVEGGVIV